MGTWPYESDSGNFAIAKIYATSSGVDYKVDLYNTSDEVISALDGNPSSKPFARAYNIMSSFKDDSIMFVYKIENVKDVSFFQERKGLLKLVPDAANRSHMTGYWETTLTDDKDGVPIKRRGTLSLYRGKVFDKSTINRSSC